MELSALADVRTLVEKHQPKEYRSKFTWRQLAGLLKRAAEGEGQQDVAEVSTALKIVLPARGCHVSVERRRFPPPLDARLIAANIAKLPEVMNAHSIERRHVERPRRNRQTPSAAFRLAALAFERGLIGQSVNGPQDR